MCILAISGPPVRMENAIICIYIYILLIFRDFAKTENARTREMKIVAFAAPKISVKMSLFAQTHINLCELMCLLTLLRPPVRREIPIIRIYIHIIEIPLRTGGRKSAKRHINSPKLM